MICFKAKEFVGRIGTDVLGIFSNAQTKPVKIALRRRIQYNYNKNIDIHCADKKGRYTLFSTCLKCTTILMPAH